MILRRLPDRRLVVEVYDGGASTRRALQEQGFTFVEEDFLNGFWGVRFTIDAPTGNGARARLLLLEKL